MFRGFNLNNENDITFKATLYKNRRESLCVLNNEWIKNVTRNLEEIDFFNIEIPKFLGKDKKFNSVYLKINAMMQIVIEETDKLGTVIKSRFILVETTKDLDKNKGIKKYKAMSFEHKLTTKRTSFEGKVMQLKSSEVEIGEGVLDKFIRECPDWSLGYIDPLSNVETIKGMENVNVSLFDNYTVNKVTAESLIWEKDITTTVKEGAPLYLSFEYKELKTYNTDGTLLITNNIINPVTEPLHMDIKKVKAYHYSDVGNRFGIRYEFTLKDGTIENRIETFTNVIDKKIVATNIKCVWETGNIIEKTHTKYINIDSLDDNWFNCLKNLETQFNSIVLFDSYKKEISVIHRDNLGKNSAYLLSYSSNVLEVTVTEESIYPSSLKVIGKDGLSIASENIYGGDIIYDYSYFKENNIMSDELVVAWSRYEEYLKLKQAEYLVLKNERMAITQRKIKIESEIKSLNERIKNLTNLLAGFIAGGDKDGNQERIKLEIDALKLSLEGCLTTRATYVEQLNTYDDDIIKISNAIKTVNATDSKGKIFTDMDVEELADIDVCEVYDDDYYSNSYGLLTNAISTLKDMTKPQIEFKITCSNLAKIIKNPKGYNILKLGDLFNVEKDMLEDFDVSEGIRLVSYVYDPKEGSIENVVFSNKLKKIDNKKSIKNIGKKTNDSSNTIGSWKNVWEDAIMSNNFAKSMREGGLDLASSMVRGKGARNYIEINESGMYISDQTDENQALYIGSNIIAISNTGFRTSNVAISSDGVIAKVLIGEMIFGEKLMASSSTGVFEITGDGLTIYDENKKVRCHLGMYMEGDIRKVGLKLYSKSGREVVISEDGIVDHNQYIYSNDLDNTNPIEFDHIVDEGVFEVRKTMLNLSFKEFRATVKSVSSGGNSQTSSSGGGGTSSSGGGGTSSSEGGFDFDVFSGNGTWEQTNITVPMAYYPDDYWIDGDKNSHAHVIDSQKALKHRHSVILKKDAHSHQVYSHVHSIDSHVHSLDTTHNHTLIPGIYLSTKPSNCSVYVNNVLVASGINDDYSIDIAKYLEINKANKIKITSSTLGRLQITVFSKMFVGF